MTTDMQANQYRKKPVVIDAFRVEQRALWPDWFHDAVSSNAVITHGMGKFGEGPVYCEIKTLEGVMRADDGDWIIRGVKGELYPCKPDIFAATYEPVASRPDAQAEPAYSWLPIASAPRDGSNILIRFGSHGVSQAKYVAGTTHPWKFIDTNDGITWLVNHAVDTEYGPTHWMPLPSAHRPEPGTITRTAAPQAAAQGLPSEWRELCRRLYVELFHCDQQMRSTRDQDGEPRWTQSAVVCDVLKDAKAALAAPCPDREQDYGSGLDVEASETAIVALATMPREQLERLENAVSGIESIRAASAPTLGESEHIDSAEFAALQTYLNAYHRDVRPDRPSGLAAWALAALASAPAVAPPVESPAVALSDEQIDRMVHEACHSDPCARGGGYWLTLDEIRTLLSEIDAPYYWPRRSRRS